MKLFESVKRLVKQQISLWFKTNEFIHQNKESIFNRGVIYFGHHPLRHLVLIGIIYLILYSIGVIFFNQIKRNYLPESNYLLKDDLFVNLLTIQATIAALVYPIVISFVAIILQKRPSAKALMQLYLLKSGATLAGLSSMVLILIMGAQLFISITLNPYTVYPLVPINSLWFCYNILLTCFFIYNTIEFINPDSQIKIIRSYVINYSLPLLVRKLYMECINWEELFETEKYSKGIEIKLGKHTLSKNEYKIEKKINKTSTLNNVYLYPIQWLINKHLKNRVGDEAGKLSIIFPLKLGDKYDLKHGLIRIKGINTLSRFEKSLIAKCFQFKSNVMLNKSLSLYEILKELELEVLSCIRTNDYHSFPSVFNNLIKLHIDVFLACDTTINGEKKNFSIELHDASLGFLGVNLYKKIFQYYESISYESVVNLEVNTTYFQHLSYLAFSYVYESSMPYEIQRKSLLFSYYLIIELGHWWQEKINADLTNENYLSKIKNLDPALANKYNTALRVFVGGWNHVQNSLRYKIEGQVDVVLVTFQNNVKLLMNHIQNTALMLLSAVYRGDIVAAKRFVDVLLKWQNQYDQSFDNYFNLELYHQYPFANPNLDVEISQLINEFKLKPENDNTLKLIEFFSIRIFLEDIWLLTMEVMTQWLFELPLNLYQNSLIPYMLIELVKGTNFHDGGEIQMPIHESIILQSFQIKFRQYLGLHDRANSYISYLNGFIRQVENIQERDMVAGRLYSGTDITDINLFYQGAAILFILSNNCGFNAKKIEEFKSYVFNNKSMISPLTFHLNKLLDFIKSDHDKIEGLITFIQERTEGKLNTSEALENTRVQLNEMIDTINAINNSP